MTARTSPPTTPATAAPVWPGFTDADAQAWSRCLARYRPTPVSIGELARISGSVARDGAVADSGWRERADLARGIGFTPASFSSWRCSLDHVPSALYRAHPYNHAVEWPGHQPGYPFDAQVWAGWGFLVAQGLDADVATHYALARAEEDGFTSADSREYEAGRTFALGYEDALAKRFRAYGITEVDSAGGVHSTDTQDTRRHNQLLRAHREDQPAFRERSIAARAAARQAHTRPEIRTGFARVRRSWLQKHRTA